jgi:preprotein translocase subunit SecE
MNTKADTSGSVLDIVKLLVAATILVGGVGAYYFYADASVLLRAIGVLLALIAAIGVAVWTTQGQTLWRFVQGARVELRKVIWPTREEALQTTLAVLVFALVMGVFFWLLDLFLLWVTRLLTGQGG